ncbi:MAG: glycine zipper family protein [Deltaproteobacteria bacterium]|nr:glycine zipper family protein [Deltaproteobacteria bacterium]MBW2478420.1 glycine zipper family protein [Deltaproteobacteria bacterium]
MNFKRYPGLLMAAAVLAGCATIPAGPGVMVLPAPGIPFEAFQSDDSTCKQWALQQIQVPPHETVNRNIAGGAAVGTLVGAGLGAAIGSASGNAATGAAIGAGSGFIGGAAAASGPAYTAGWEAQRRYDFAYQQCMYSKGHQIPGLKRPARQARWVPPPPPPGHPYGPPKSTGALPPPP